MGGTGALLGVQPQRLVMRSQAAQLSNLYSLGGSCSCTPC